MDLRQQLAEAKIQLAQAKDDYQTRKAIVEYTALLVGGPNKEARDAAAAHALREDASVVEALGTLRNAEARLLRIEADLASYEDQRKQARLIADERHTVALERLAAAWENLAGAPVVQAQGRALVATEEWFGR